MTNPKAIIKRTAVYGIILLIYIIVLTAFDIHCPFADIIGIKCPTCGASRALVSLLTLDFQSYYSYHPLAIPLVVSVWIMINIEYFKHKIAATSVAIFVVSLNFILYLSKIII